MSARVAVDFGVYPVPGERGRYHVKSSGRRGAVYLVDLEDCASGCGCRDFEVRSGMLLYPAEDCKHMRLARVYQGLQRCFGGGRAL